MFPHHGLHPCSRPRFSLTPSSVAAPSDRRLATAQRIAAVHAVKHPSFHGDLVDILAQLNRALADRYEVIREVGAGGMATVYLARDVKHGRQVALKVLKPELGAVLGVERFLAEITVTANLQHPNLLPLFDSGEADGLLFYVMPFVEGETLRARLDRERQLPIDEAVHFTIAIAGALEYAHQQHVIHRDLKPENILLQAGQPVIADFGIALAVSNAGGARVTQTGLSLGTPQYMSPEQATGDRNVDRRTDIYSLGAMTYEMITGELPHSGATAQAIIARLMTEEVRPLSVLRRSVPLHIDGAVRKALEKLPADRYESANSFATALTDSRQFATATMASPSANARRTPSRLTIAVGGLLAVMTAVAAWSFTRPAPAAPTNQVVRFSVKVGEAEQRYLGSAPWETRYGVPVLPAMTLSPDGKLFVYAAWTGSDDSLSSGLYLRRLNEERAHLIAGSEGGANPFFSPDGAWVGFIASGSMKRAPVSGGATETVLSGLTGAPGGATWGDDDTILYSYSGALYRVAASGGAPTIVLPADTMPGAGAYATPHLLPGSRVALVGIHTRDPARSRIAALEVGSGHLTPVLTNGQHPFYSASGHLLFLRQGTLMAVGFDPDRITIRGEPVPVLENIGHAVNLPNTELETGAGQFALSSSGHLAYASGGVFQSAVHELMRVSPDGNATALGVTAPGIYAPRLSPVADRLAFHARPSARSQASAIFVRDLVRGVTTKLTGAEDGFLIWFPTWSPDGRSILFMSDRENGVSNLYTIPADGGAATRLTTSMRSQTPTSWSSSGVISFLQDGDIWTIPPGGAPSRFFSASTTETHASVSPDGRWMAYVSNPSGRNEIHVRPYPGPEPAVQISEGGGTAPAWSTDGKRLYYLTIPTPGRLPSMMAVDVAPGAPFRAGRAVSLIASWPYVATTPATAYDVAEDGSFVVPTLSGGRVSGNERTRFRVGEIHVVLNFLSELRERVKN